MSRINLSDYRFQGTFRSYQQDVLDSVEKYLDNRKIHIVAAPGSGKTILGLELIRRLNAPALVLSPSVTIRQQWGERFAEGFMQDPGSIGEVFSYSLKTPNAITSITYQALHAAFNKRVSDEEVETDVEGKLEHAEIEDYTAFDLMKTVKSAGIKTICLDEAHHLKNEWQKALEGFVAAMGNVDLIALTATPPYDSSLTEWNRYISLCGEIDAEIFIPELVKQKTLCPHQDYIYFSYPTKEEKALLNSFKDRAYKCIDEILSSRHFVNAVGKSKILRNYGQMYEQIFDAADEYASVLTLAARAGVDVPKQLISMLSPQKSLKKFSLETAQTALGFMLRSPEVFGEAETKVIRNLLNKNGFMSGASVALAGDRKIKKMLSASMGKLSGINSIAAAEFADIGDKLRMLILTDFIRKDSMPIIGTTGAISVMGTVPIFESVRRAVGGAASIALLSGSLVIIPKAIVADVAGIAESRYVSFREKPLENAEYSELIFTGTNKHKVSVLTEAFEKGLINILIGTKSLLGEGWDSPCINSLILASFVGSFMLSNQMRGRAIRIYKNDPGKTANIWHLATIEPPYLLAEKTDKIKKKVKHAVTSRKDFTSEDFVMLTRRFQGFLAPAYNSNVIASGIDRIDIIAPPFNEAGFERINAEMLRLASEREAMAASWDKTLGQFDRPAVSDACEVPARVRPTGFLLLNLTALMIWVSVAVALVQGIIRIPFLTQTLAAFIISSLFAAASVIFVYKATEKLIKFLSPEKTVKTLAACLLKAMKQLELIESKKAKVALDRSASGYSYCVLKNANAHDNERFGKAIGEMLSAIDNPRYILVKKRRLLPSLSYTHSYACPSVIGSNKERVQVLAGMLRKTIGRITMIYTRTPEGRAHLTKCKRKAYLNRNEITLKRLKFVI